jgi:proline dehydrogenase
MEAKLIFLYDTEKAFATKNYSELKRSWWLFRLISRPAAVKMLTTLTNFGIRIGLPIKGLIRSTIFKQFCGGESLEESTAVVRKLERANVKTILDYSVEGKDDPDEFRRTAAEVIRIIRLARQNPAIPYTCIKLTGLVSHVLLEKQSAGIALDNQESHAWESFLLKLEDIFQEAAGSNVPVYIDAEESWLQPAIDQLAEKYMKRYNSQRFVVLTTLQMYRHDRLAYLTRLVADARRNGYKLGIKLVRGAYMEKEAKRAAELNYPSPIHKTKNDTDLDFDRALDVCLDNIDIIMLCAGTHNEASTLKVVELMKQKKLSNNHPHIYFSQLYGMSDHISYNLAHLGYNVTKYLPYGPIRSVIPYLVRRAQENTAIAGQMSREFMLLSQEKKRREQLKLLS